MQPSPARTYTGKARQGSKIDIFLEPFIDTFGPVFYNLLGMVRAVSHAENLGDAPVRVSRYLGSVVYMYAYDVAYEMAREAVPSLLGRPVVPYEIDSDKRSPRHRSFFRPAMVTLPALEREGPTGRLKLERSVKLWPVGAISIIVRVPFEVESLGELVAYHDLHSSSWSLNDEVRALAEEVRRELAQCYVRPVNVLGDEEAYTVFCLEAPVSTVEGVPLAAETWFAKHRRDVAALLTQETNVDLLSRQEAEESTSRFLSYYQNDLVVVDWDAALLIDEASDFEETLYVMELANLQLAELEAYDQWLDGALERSYRDLGKHSFRARALVARDLKEIRIDLARVSDELSNITKFFGDWHLARVYAHMAARFHLARWHHSLDEKLRTLDDLYQLLKHDQNNRWMLILEATIVLLFIIDLVILFLGLQ